MKGKRRRSTSAGPLVGAAGGGPAFDPSENVLDLVDAAVTRLNDIAVLRAELAEAKAQRIEDLSELREQHAREIRALDADRLEKVRLVDQLNANQLAQQIRGAVDTLATTTAATAETLRNQATATAQAVAAQTERVVNPIIERLAALERASYTGQGRQAIEDPQSERLAALVEKLATSQSTTTGKSAGSSATWAAVGAIVTLLLALAGFFATRGGGDKPSVTYVPVPAGVQSTTTPAGAKPP